MSEKYNFHSLFLIEYRSCSIPTINDRILIISCKLILPII